MTRVMTLIPLLLLLCGCASPVPSPAPDPTAPALAGTSWVATLIENGFAIGRRPTIQFRDDGAAVGTTGCTVFFASAQIEGSALRIRNLQLEPETARAGTCDSLHKVQQERFLANLESVRLIHVQSGKAILLDRQRRLLMLLERREGP